MDRYNFTLKRWVLLYPNAWMSKGYVPQYFAHLHLTTPLRDPSIIDDTLSGFIDNKEYTALRSAHKMSETSHKTFEVDDGKLKCLCTGDLNIESANLSRQSFPATYNSNGYIDVIRSELVQSRGQVHGDSVQAYITDATYEVDEPREFEYLEHIVAEKSGYWTSLFDKS
jgi:CMP-N,N'-diacetyllegionaminic acid synthase